MPYIIPEDRHQIIMESYEDTVPSLSYLRIIDIIVDKIVAENPDEYKRFNVTDAGPQTYKTETLMKLLLYGYFNGISSSRKLEKETQRNKELIWLLGNLHPDHWTISRYRKNHSEQILHLGKKIRKFLKHYEYINIKTVAVDGTKVKANTNKEFLTLKQCEKKLKDYDNKMRRYLEELHRNDKIEDIESESENDTGHREKALLEKIEALESEIAMYKSYKQQMKDKKKDKISLTDSDAVFMRSTEGFIPAYNFQTVVDSKNNMIASCYVTTQVNDIHQLLPSIEAINDFYSYNPEKVLADKGYFAPDDIAKVEKQGSEVFVPVPDLKSNKDKFTYDAEKDVYICPEGQELKPTGRNMKKNSSVVDVYSGDTCCICNKKKRCLKNRAYKRVIKRYHNEDYRKNYKKKMQEESSQEMVGKRKSIVEHPFGTMKIWMGKIPLLLRGIKNVTTELNLWSTVYNIKRLINIESINIIIDRINKFSWAT